MKKTEIEVIGLCFFNSEFLSRFAQTIILSPEGHDFYAERIFRILISLRSNDYSLSESLVFGFFFHGSRNITFEHTCYAGCPTVDGVVVHL